MKYQWNLEGGRHALCLEYDTGVFTIYVTPNVDFNGKVDAEFPWTMEAQFLQTSNHHKTNCQWSSKLREPLEADAKAKALFSMRSFFLNGLTKLNRAEGRAPLDGLPE